MKTPSFQYSVRGAKRFTRLLLVPALAFMLLQGCTDLSESPTSVITPDNFFKTDAEVLGSLASVYAVMRNTTGAYYDVSNISSDELITARSGSRKSTTSGTMPSGASPGLICCSQRSRT